MNADPATILVEAVTAAGSAAVTIVAMTWNLARKVQAFHDAHEQLKRSFESHTVEDKDFHKEVDAYVAEDRRAWLELNRTLGRIEGSAARQQDWSETTGSTIMRPREKSRPDR